MKLVTYFRLVTLVSVAFLGLETLAANVTESDARAAAAAWARANASAFKTTGTPVAAIPHYETNGVTVLWWTVTTSDGGATIIAPDTDIEPVIARLEKYTGELPAAHPLVALLTADMRQRLAVIAAQAAAAQAQPVSLLSVSAPSPSTSSSSLAASIATANTKWARYTNGDTSLMAITSDNDAGVMYVLPGFEQDGVLTHWNQGLVDGTYCYNYYTPEHAVCGCVATAGAAVMQYLNVTGMPEKVEKQCTFKGENVTYETKPGVYDWTVLPKSMGGTAESNQLSEEAVDLLGRAAYNMGVCVQMNYYMDETGESGAVLSKVATAYKEDFGFKDARAFYPDDPTQYPKLIGAQIRAGVPVILGISKDAGGHAVVAVGYGRDTDGKDYTRVFMGWGGSGDAWYALPEVQNYKQLDTVITMIGYDTDRTIPVVGSCNMPGIAIVSPSLTNELGQAITNYVGMNGYFGFRVAPGIEAADCIFYNPIKGIEKKATFTLGEEPDPSSETYLTEFVAWLPDEINWPLLNSTVVYSQSAAKAKALAQGKAILAVSGTTGKEATTALLNYIYELDDQDETFKEKFVFLCVSAYGDAQVSDGNPSIAIFNPNDYDPTERWTIQNGRLAYANFTEVNDGFTNTTYTADEVVAATAQVLETGYDAYERQMADFTVVIAGAQVVSDAGVNSKAKTPYAYTNLLLKGVSAGTVYQAGNSVETKAAASYSDLWKTNELAVFRAQRFATNETLGIVYECVGWTTNAVPANGLSWDAADGERVARSPANSVTPVSVEQFAAATNAGNVAEIQLPETAGASFCLTWIWQPVKYHVTAEVTLVNGVKWGTVSPEDGWYDAGARLTIVATPDADKGFGFDYWAAKRVSMDNADFITASPTEAAIFDNGTALSFFVTESVSVQANFRTGSNYYAINYQLTLACAPAELAAKMPPVKTAAGVTLAVGANLHPDTAVTLTLTDATTLLTNVVEDVTNVYQFVGIQVGSGATQAVATVTGLVPGTYTMCWEDVTPEPERKATPVAPHGFVTTGAGGVETTNAIFTIYRTNDTDLAVQANVANGFAGCTYTLFGASEVVGTYEKVTNGKAGSVLEYTPTEDNVSFSLYYIFDPDTAGPAKFFKLNWEQPAK